MFVRIIDENNGGKIFCRDDFVDELTELTWLNLGALPCGFYLPKWDGSTKVIEGWCSARSRRLPTTY